jgi:hypothetical protein
MITYLKSETERLEKEIKVANYKMEETAKNGISTELIGRIGKVTELTKELSTLIKTSWIFARENIKDYVKRMETLVHLQGYLSQVLDEKHKTEYEKLLNLNIEDKNKCDEYDKVISYCEAKAKEHKIELEDGEK